MPLFPPCDAAALIDDLLCAIAKLPPERTQRLEAIVGLLIDSDEVAYAAEVDKVGERDKLLRNLAPVMANVAALAPLAGGGVLDTTVRALSANLDHADIDFDVLEDWPAGSCEAAEWTRAQGTELDHAVLAQLFGSDGVLDVDRVRAALAAWDALEDREGAT